MSATRKILFLLGLLMTGPFAFSQAVMTATITDSDSQAWIGGNYTVQLVNLSSGAVIPQGQAFVTSTGATVTTSFGPTILDGSGALSITLTPSASITPAGTAWKFRICPNTIPQSCGGTTLTITSSGSISSQLSASITAPRIGGGIGTQGYADVEANAVAGNTYYNILTPVQRCYAAAWANCGGGGGAVSSVFTRTGAVVATSGDYTVSQVTGAAPLASPALTGTPTVPTASLGTNTTQAASTAYVLANAPLSQKVVYTSKLAGVTGGVAVVPGSSATSTTDSATALNAAISGGNVDLEVDSGYALSTSLVLSSNTTIHCIAPQYGFIMQASANLYVLVNAHQNAPTTASGTGGFLPSNITDKNIRVDGCMLNANSVQAVTGTISGGAAHTISGSTGLFVTGVFFDGVQGLTFTNNEIYDSGIWAFFASNTLNANVSNNYLHQPTPLTASKFTDGIHFIGPDEYLFVNKNNIMAGDDSLAFNAEDGNRTGLSGPGFDASQWPGVKWGPITDVQANNNTFNNGYYGLRIQDGSELIDRIMVSNTEGNLCGNTGTFQGISTFGPGNVAKVTIDGWTVQTDGTCNTFSQPYNFSVNENIASLQIRGVNIQNPGVNWPLFTQFGGAIGNLSIRDWDLNTASSTVSNLFAFTSGTIGQLAVSGLNWDDGVGSGSVFSGATVPTTLTCSNYAGPNRLLAGGFSPAVQNGDCFTNTYAAVPAAIHFWPMTDGGSTFVDNIGTTNLAASNVTYSVTSGMGSTAVAQFNGTSSAAHASGVDSTLNFNGAQPMSVCYWSAGATAVAATAIGNLQTTSSYQGWEAGYGGSGPAANFLVVGAVTSNQLTLTNTAASSSGLYCWTYNGNLAPSGLLLYVNGALHSTTTTTATLTSGSTSTSAVYVGSRSNSTNFYSGALGYMRVWNQVLTAPQISTLYAGGPH